MNTTDGPRFSPKNGMNAYVSVLSASLFFFFVFLQINMFNALDPSLIQAFNISTTQLGTLSACYYYATVLCLIPAGLMLDRFSTRIIILTAMVIMLAMTLLFSLTHSYVLACLSKLITGICGAFALLSCIRIATAWFSCDKLAWIIGLVITIAMIGGICAQTPFTLLVDHTSWRSALRIDTIIGLGLFLIIWAGVADTPEHKIKHPAASTKQSQSTWSALEQVANNPQNWLAGCYTLFMNLPIMVLGAIWGSAYLVRIDHLNRPMASIITMMLFLGTIIGSPLFGLISDRIGRRKPIMIIGAAVSLVLFAWLIGIPEHHRTTLLLLFLAIGFFTSSQVLSYPLIAESNPPHLLGAAQGLSSILIMLSGMFQPMFGAILYQHQPIHVLLQNIPTHNYQHAMLMFIAACALSLIICLGLTEGKPHLSTT